MNGMGNFTPYSLERVFNADDQFELGVRISSASGWIDLNDEDNFRIEASSFGDSSATWRKREVTSDFAEGSYVVNAVRENINEALAVWCTGENYFLMETNIEKLTAALSQLSYQLLVRTNEASRYYDCTVADYTVTRQREYRHACIALVKANVPRHPADTLVLTAVDEL